MADDPARVDLVGVHGGQVYGAAAALALRQADVVMGSPRHLPGVRALTDGRLVELDAELHVALSRAAEWRHAGRSVVLLASGDPGFFGLTRMAAARLGPGRLRIHPAPSSVALAAARLGLSWDDAVVVSAHGRPLEQAVDVIARCPKVAVLTAPDQPPQALGSLLVERATRREVAVASRLGEPEEEVWRGDVAGLAAGCFDPVSVVVCTVPVAEERGWAWGRPDDQFAHRDGMITKSEVRAVALGKLALPRVGVMWDVGAGSGSVSAECAGLSPGLRVLAVERRPDDLERIRANTAGTGVEVVAGEAPGALAELPDPDRVFVGGGGVPVLEAALSRLRPGGVIVATYASIERAAAGARLLGSLVQVSISRGVAVGDSVRLASDNPVFVCWGPA